MMMQARQSGPLCSLWGRRSPAVQGAFGSIRQAQMR